MTSKKHQSRKIQSARDGTLQPGTSQESFFRDAGSGRGSEFMAGRRSLAYELHESGKLTTGRLGLEILFLLPDEFVQFYTDLFHRALGGQGGGAGTSSTSSAMHGRSGGVGIAKGNPGTVLGSDTRLQASGGVGKRYKNTGLVISDEVALRVKGMVDRGLRELISDAQRSFSRAKKLKSAEKLENGLELDPPDLRSSPENRDSPKVSGGLGTGSNSGARHDDGNDGISENARNSGRLSTAALGCRGRVDDGRGNTHGCGRFLKESWNYCPSCGTPVRGINEKAREVGPGLHQAG